MTTPKDEPKKYVEPHTCPYKTEINDDYELCDCDEEQQQCMNDI